MEVANESNLYLSAKHLKDKRTLQNYENPVLPELLWDIVDFRFDFVPSGVVLFKKNR